MKKHKHSSLSQEAEFLHPYVEKYYELYRSEQLLVWDLVGIYILLTLSLRKQNNWANSLLLEPITDRKSYRSILLLDIPDILDRLNPVFLQKRLKTTPSLTIESLTILDIFNHFNLQGLKNNNDLHVNRSVINWALGSRPIHLMHSIPSPMEVLQQQARGERVVTMFLTEEELSEFHTSKLTYMNGGKEHARDALEFLTHDLKHMEHYIDPVTHYEQKGFFRCILKINKGKVKSFFINTLGYPIDLWYEMEYVISDMNCFSTHLIRYVFAKLLIACRKKIVDGMRGSESNESVESKQASTIPSTSEIEEILVEEELHRRILLDWQMLLQQMGIHADCEEFDKTEVDSLLHLSHETNRCLMKLVDVSFKRGPELTVEEWTIIRDFFEYVGRIE